VVDIYLAILDLHRTGREGVLATIVRKDGSGPSATASKILVRDDGNTVGTVGGGALEQIVIREAREVMKVRKPRLVNYDLAGSGEVPSAGDTEQTGMICGGAVSVFFDYIGARPKIGIFGAGHIGKALVHHLKNLDYDIAVIDSREDVARAIEAADRIIIGSYSDVLQRNDIPECNLVVIATHSHQLDYVVLKRVYESNWNVRYIGLVASRKKAEEMRSKLMEELAGKPDFSILYSPAGLDIGGSSPDEIAISIIAEIQALRYGREGHQHMMGP
jgi:xanthine dehydrogenase accessory factor